PKTNAPSRSYPNLHFPVSKHHQRRRPGPVRSVPLPRPLPLLGSWRSCLPSTPLHSHSRWCSRTRTHHGRGLAARRLRRSFLQSSVPTRRHISSNLAVSLRKLLLRATPPPPRSTPAAAHCLPSPLAPIQLPTRPRLRGRRHGVRRHRHLQRTGFYLERHDREVSLRKGIVRKNGLEGYHQEEEGNSAAH
ncbi:hypothetical protein U9M48_033064, partial [Paspalum notatum var. saurae]